MRKKGFKAGIAFLTILLLTGAIGLVLAAESNKITGSYKNAEYTVEGLKNPDGTVVRGVLYSPLYYYGYLTTAIGEPLYRPNVVREELALISQLGFNSVRLHSGFYSALVGQRDRCEKILDNYEDLLTACRENHLTASFILPYNIEENYSDEDSFTRWLITEIITRFDGPFSDVIVQWEIANEPDLNIFTTDTAWGKNQYLTNETWLNVSKPQLQWARDLVKELGATRPVSIGAMTAPLFTSWDAENFDVANVHPYMNTLELTDSGFTQRIAKMDMETLGYVRPIVFTEIGWTSGNHSRIGDMMQYCHENGIAYYVSSFAANWYWQNIQGIVDVGGTLRTSTLPFSMLQKYDKWWPVETGCYGDSPSGGGVSIYQAVSSAVSFRNSTGSLRVQKMSVGAQEAHGQMGAMVGYWTPDFRELFLTSKGDTVAKKAEEAMKNSLLSILPYIRTYGTYANDNALGGTLNANYFENMHKYNTDRGQVFFRARFTMDKGKDGTKGIFTEYVSNLVLRQPLDASKTYKVSIDLNPSVDSYNGIAFACGDDNNNNYGALNPGIYLRVSHKESEDSSTNQTSLAQAANTIQVYTIDKYQVQKWKSTIRLTEDLFDKDGYISLTVEFVGNGTKEHPFVATVFSGDKELGNINVSSAAMSPDGCNLALFGYDSGMNYFDNLVLKDEQDNVLLSDTFENGKYDYELLTYSFEIGDNSNEGNFGGTSGGQNYVNSNQDYYDRLLKLAEKLIDGEIKYSVPENFAAYICDSLLVCEWDYDGIGESGFEIQRSVDGQNWKSYWRSMAGTRSAIIPLFEDDTNYYYRVSPVTSKNEVKHFCSSITAELGNGAADGYLASYTDTRGNKQTVEAIGSGVFRTSDVNEIPEENNGLWIDRYVKRSDYNSDIQNEKLPGESTQGSAQNPNRFGVILGVLCVVGVIMLAAIAVVIFKIFRSSGSK